jgi:transposase InsO family protein
MPSTGSSPRQLDYYFTQIKGVQYSSKLFVDYMKALGITQSMRRRANCWDNSVMERFFRSLKSERLNHISFINHESAVNCIESYIYFYNYKRLHSSLAYITPVQKSAELKKMA